MTTILPDCYATAPLIPREYYDRLAAYVAELENENVELQKNTASARLIDAWCTEHKKQMSWAKMIELMSIVDKMPQEEKTRLLSMYEPEEEGALEAKTVLQADRIRELEAQVQHWKASRDSALQAGEMMQEPKQEEDGSDA